MGKGVRPLLEYFFLAVAERLKDEIKRDGISSETIEKYEKVVRTRWIRAVIIHITLLLALLAYSFIGAAIFQALEQEEAVTTHINIAAAKQHLLDQIWLEAQNHTEATKQDWKDKVDALLTDYDIKIVDASFHGIDVTNKSQHVTNTTQQLQDWDFWNSLLFCGTVYTTIGYGHLTPATVAGRIATMFYAVIGIPLCLIVLADLGGLLSELIKYLMRLVKKAFYRCCRPNASPSKEKLEHLSGLAIFSVLVVTVILYLFSGAAMYQSWEDQWSYFDSFWFVFVSFSTIGFGDLVPNHPKFFLLTIIYIFFGLALISTGFTVLQQVLQSSINKASDQLDAKLGRLDSSASESSVNPENSRDCVTLVHMNRSTSNSKHSPSHSSGADESGSLPRTDP